MPLINGEKYACTSCIKGHRVSGCNHTDRELHHINPKGRPVKQCEHCRTARKSKSHHHRCDCGEKKDKDKHKDKGDAKGEIFNDASSDDLSNHTAVDDGSCCCNSGSKCICGIKKESPELKLDTGKHTLHGARAKPKLTSTQSESTLTVFANGHHKPCHRNNNSAHVSGAPYKIPRPHSLHGSHAFANYTQGESYVRPNPVTQRSVDTLSLSNNDFYAMFGSSQRSITGLPMTSLAGSYDDNLLQESLFTPPTSAFGQDGGSPSESQTSEPVTTQWPWSSSATPVNRNFGFGSLSTSPSQDCLPNLESDWSIPSAGLDPWSANDLPLDSSKLTDSLAQPISHSGESKLSAPGMTTASSSQSEIGEPSLFGNLNLNPQSAVSESLFWEDSPVYRLATSVPGEMRAVPTSMPTTTGIEASSFTADVGFAPNTLAFSSAGLDDLQGPKDVTSTATSVGSTMEFGEPRSIMMPNTLDDVVPNDPWLMDQSSVNLTNLFGGVGSFDDSYSNWP